ncbi:MAG: aldo/keto reductase [Candidatus Eisenbacteria bacterium]|nr:aldo/keto reductase [Candidatus Eisenbacteria bacterium]
MSPDDPLVPERQLGSTGERVSMLGLGGAHIAHFREDRDAIEFVRSAIDTGVTFMDNAWEYHEGRAEELMGRALEDGYRDRVFLMTKHHGRNRATAERHLEDSLRRLRTDVIDLWQFHEVIYNDDPDMIFARGGGIEAAVAAQRAGKVRYIGFTGHKDPAIHRRMLDTGFAWDAVQMPLNVMDAHFRSFEQTILPILEERGIAVLGMKPLAGGHILESDTVTAAEALSYVWSLPVSTVISGMDAMAHLTENVETARAWTAMERGARAELLSRTRDAASDGSYEPYKTDVVFDAAIGRELHGLS